MTELPRHDVVFATENEAIPETVKLDVTISGTEYIALGSPFFLGAVTIRELAVPLLGAGSGNAPPPATGAGNYAY